MPVPVTDLKPGDRVLLNCPKARGQAKREAQFKGIYKSIADTLSEYDATAILRGPGTDALFESGQAVAGFILQSGDPATFRYPDGQPLDAPGWSVTRKSLTPVRSTARSMRARRTRVGTPHEGHHRIDDANRAA